MVVKWSIEIASNVKQAHHTFRTHLLLFIAEMWTNYAFEDLKLQNLQAAEDQWSHPHQYQI